MADMAAEKFPNPRLLKMRAERRVVGPLFEHVHEARSGILDEQRIMVASVLGAHLANHGRDVALKARNVRGIEGHGAGDENHRGPAFKYLSSVW